MFHVHQEIHGAMTQFDNLTTFFYRGAAILKHGRMARKPFFSSLILGGSHNLMICNVRTF